VVLRALGLATSLVAGGCATPSLPDLVLHRVRIIDGTGAPTTGPMDVAIRDGIIVAITPTTDAPPRGVRVLDLEGHYLLPGFVDLHVHLPPDSALQEAVLRQLLRYGVTTILNPGARPGAGPTLRDRIGDDLPRMRTAGEIIDHHPGTAGPLDWAVLVNDEASLRAEVRRQAALGVDFIKVYSGMPPALVAAAVEESGRAGLPVIVHAGATTWSEAAALGVSMLVHSGYGTPMDPLVNLADPASASDEAWYRGYADAPNGPAFDTLVGRLRAGAITVVPTLAITQASGLGRDTTLLPLFETELAPERDLPGWWDAGWRTRHPQYGDDVDTAEARLLETIYWPGVLGITRAFHERGVHLGVGTDVGNSWITPGASFHHEMSLYAEAGIPPADILVMATRNGAEALGLADSIGTVRVGKRADLVVLRTDPTTEIRNTRRIVVVVRNGRVVRAD
jgi:cytosine/adenosine deaminase-related metal-dependent hydrolase